MMQFKIIKTGTSEYSQMVDLRHRILRAPLNMKVTEEELAKDVDYILLGAFFPENKLVACCFLTHIDDEVVQLRQMAIDDTFQKKGYGRQIIAFAEQTAKDLNYSRIYLHARGTAEVFYQKLGYTTEGEYFMEIGIPHIAMNKMI